MVNRNQEILAAIHHYEKENFKLSELYLNLIIFDNLILLF